MDLLSYPLRLYHLGHHRDVPRQTLLYDHGISNNWWVPIGDNLVTYTLRQPEVLAQGDTSTVVETDWTGVVRGVLLNFRNYYRLPTGACALCLPDFRRIRHAPKPQITQLTRIRAEPSGNRGFNNRFHEALY